MEWALIKPYLPLTNERSKKTISIAPLIAAWIHWGGLTLEEWSQMTASEQNEYLSFAYSFDEKLRKKLWLEASLLGGVLLSQGETPDYHRR